MAKILKNANVKLGEGTLDESALSKFPNYGMSALGKQHFSGVIKFNNGFYLEMYRITDSGFQDAKNHTKTLNTSLLYIPTVLTQIGGQAQLESKHYNAYVRRGGSNPTTTESQVAIHYENNAGYDRPIEIYVTVIGFWK